MWDRIRSDPEAYVRRILINTSSAWWRRKWNGEVPTELRRRETTVAWGKNYWMIIHGRGPVELRILVAGQPFATCKTWGYSKSDCNYDIAPHHPELSREPAAGEPVTVTVIPVHAEELWEVWFQQSAMAPPSHAAVDLS